MEEWKECKLGDFFELHRGYDLTKSEIKSGPYPVVCSTSIMGYHNEYKVKAPGVVIGRSGTLGEVQFIDTDYWPHNTSLYVSDFKGNSPKFIKYFLQLFGTGNVGGGSAVPTLNRNHLQALTVRVPPLPTQQKIAAILSSLDDKIELNNKINTNLEQQAQAIFEDFFPNVIDDDGLNKMEELITFSNGKKRPEESGIIPVFGGNGILAYTNKSNNENCCIIGRVGAYCGNVFLSQNKCWISDNAISAKSKDTGSQFFIFFLLKKANLQTRHIGSGQPLLTQGILNSISINIPQKQTIEQFNDLLKPIFDQIFNNSRQNENLVSIRDTLLPKLMNGEIVV